MSKHKGKILVVDDNTGIRNALKILLSMHFDGVEMLSSPNELINRVREFNPDVVLLDMNFESDINTGNEGLFWIGELKEKFPKLEVVLFTAYADILVAVEGMKRGAFDFIVKPWENEKLFEILRQGAQKHIDAVKKDNSSNVKGENANRQEFDRMLWGNSPRMQGIKKVIAKISPTDATVLITGENGTGKDVLAKEIHRLSLRNNKKMVSIDAGAITETLFESELFGHVKGAFTDAHADYAGKFEQANDGTLFLDEIGNIPLHLQSKLLKVLQDRTIVKIGDNKQIPINIRLICATNMDIENMVMQGKFREDLYYRINTIHVQLPPLRERSDEIERLSENFMQKFAAKYNRSAKHIDSRALQMLKTNYWSGNIRELHNCIEKAVILSEGDTITIDDLQPDIASTGRMSAEPNIPGATDGQDSGETLKMAEEKVIRAAMERYNGNLTLVAKNLDISRPTLYNKLKKYDI